MPYSSPSDSEAIGQNDHRIENGRAREICNNLNSADEQVECQLNGGTAEPTEKVNSQDAVNSGDKSGSLKQNGAANGDVASSRAQYNQAYEVKWDDDEDKRDPLNPYNKSELRKWIILFVVSMSAFCV